LVSLSEARDGRIPAILAGSLVDLARVSSVIAIRGLRVVRGGKEVLARIDLDVEAGAVTGLLGPSGSGKSTLIRAIVGVQIVAEGSVTVVGLPAGSSALRTRAGYMTQSPSVYGDLTVRENLDYFGRLIGVDATHIEDVIERVGLRSEIQSIVENLSGGQRARVSLGAALLGEPDLLVLDEPTVGLDPLLRRDLWDFFHSLAERGTTLLVSSHVMDEAERCDRLILLREGRVLTSATPRELRQRTGAQDLDAAFLELIREASQE
jgi:ABC-2 type transport system ATP-binding protein